MTVYIEVRLLQQDATTTRSISSQLAAANVYTISLNGDDEKRDIIRLQQVIMEKVQKRDGTPTKFVAEHPGAVNLVAVDVSSIILGMFDLDDCKLVTLGDCSVQPAFQRGIFGLFQEPDSRHPQEIQAVADGFAHVRSTLHGILFLFRAPKSEPYDYSLERCLERNPRLMDQGTAKTIREAFQPALPLEKEVWAPRIGRCSATWLMRQSAESPPACARRRFPEPLDNCQIGRQELLTHKSVLLSRPGFSLRSRLPDEIGVSQD